MNLRGKRCLRRIMLVLGVGALVSAMNMTWAEAKKVSSVKIDVSVKELVINKREKKKLKAVIKPKKKVKKKLKWKSSKPSVVSVNQKGVIRGRKYGRATITARATDGSKKKARIRVRVGKKISRISLPAKNWTLDVGKSFSLKAQVSPSNATKKKVTYRSSQSKVAKVSSSGTVYGKKEGTATITAYSTDGTGKKASCKVKVRIPSKSVKVDTTQIRVEAGYKHTINATVLPENASNQDIKYVSLNPAVATVEQNGEVKGVGPGTVTIRVEAGDGKSYTTVQVEVYKVELQNEKLIAHRGYSSEAPENTTVAFELAVKNGFYGVECDVRKTFDGEFVIMHDATLERMCGYNLNVSALDLQQLKEYDITAGANISKYPDLTIPTLEEYLVIMQTSETVHPFIELKEEFSVSELTEIVEQVREKGLLERTYFISMYKSNLLSLKTIEGVNTANLQYVYGADDETKSVPVDESVVQWCIFNGIDLDARHTLISASTVSLLHDAGRKVNVWTVNDATKAYEFVKDMNVDMLTTEILLKS